MQYMYMQSRTSAPTNQSQQRPVCEWRHLSQWAGAKWAWSGMSCYSADNATCAIKTKNTCAQKPLTLCEFLRRFAIRLTETREYIKPKLN